jgi:hypothetical protein
MVPPARGNNPSRRSQQTSSIVMSPENATGWLFCPAEWPLLLSKGLSDLFPIRKAEGLNPDYSGVNGRLPGRRKD